MAGISGMREYIHMTARIISSVLSKEVVICNEKGMVLGDSIYEETADFEVYPVTEKSMLLDSMKTGNVLIRENVKDTVVSCRTCKKRMQCDINSIISYPILNRGRVLGAIGLYSPEKNFDGKSEEARFLNEFLGRMSELISSKEEEQNLNNVLTLEKYRLTDIIEHIDMAVCSIDSGGAVIHTNKNFRQMFRVSGKSSGNIRDIKPLWENEQFHSMFISDSAHISNDVQIQTDAGRIYVYVTINKQSVGTDYAGAVIYFRRMDSYLSEYHGISGGSTDVYFDDIIGTGHVMEETRYRAMKFAESNSTILLLGESGTGKELFARAIHNAGSRRDRNFVVVNCAAIPDNLLESELFGYEDGAFTGSARGGRPGKFQLADGGTLFLDEIGELPLHLQPKLLRALQEKKICKVGGSAETDVDIRIIAATNRDLEKMMINGEFREDLYYRISVAPLHIPPLRERKPDIRALTDYFLKTCEKNMGKRIVGINQKAMEILEAYSWPGNVRELQNAIEFAANISESGIIEPDNLPQKIRNGCKDIHRDEGVTRLRDLERREIRKAISIYGNDLEGKEQAARALGIGIATLYRKIKEDTKNK